MPRRAHKPPKSEDFDISRLYKETDPLVVPRWQRDYAWDPDDHVKKLLDDLSDFWERSQGDPGRYYLLGQVIVVVNDDEENEIVDGQQRLTTIYLLLISLLNTMRERADLTVRKNSTVFALLDTAVVSLEDGVRLKSPYQEGTKVFKHLFEHGRNRLEGLGELTQPQRNLLEVYEVIEEWISENLVEEADIVGYAELILNKVYFTRLSIEDIPLALDYFEKMNRRGLPLAAADLLKNFMFAQVPDDEYDGLTEAWKDMAKELDRVDRSTLKSTEGFIKSWAISESGTKINGTEPLLEFWKTKLNTKAKILEFRSTLKSTAEFFQKSANGVDYRTGSSPILEGVRHFNGSQHLSVMFAARHLDEFAYVCELIERRFLLYTFSRERTATFESMIPNWCKALAALPKEATQDEILTASKKASSFIVDNASEATMSFVESLSYLKVSHHKKLRFVLATVARHLDKQARQGDYTENMKKYLQTVRRGVAGIDLDHVYGQQYFVDAPIEKKVIFNSIGSLSPVFSSDHREQTHLTPRQKEPMYRMSRYILTKSLAEIGADEPPRVREVLTAIQTELPVSLDDWSTGFVKKRTTWIAEKFVEALGVEELTSPLPEE